MEHVFRNIDPNTFKPKAAIRKLQIVIGQNNKPSLTVEPTVKSAMVDTTPESIYYMLPSYIISYAYNESGVVRLVKYHIEADGRPNSLRATIVSPAELVQINGDESAECNFSKTIEPEKLFQNLKRNYDLDDKEYELTLNPIRYRHIINTTILKQYLRENMLIGEQEVETTQSAKQQFDKRHSAAYYGSGSSNDIAVIQQS